MHYTRFAVSVAFAASLFSTAFAYPVQAGGTGLVQRSTIIPQYVPAIARRAGNSDDANGDVPSVNIVNDEEAADEDADFELEEDGEDLVSEDGADEDEDHWDGDGHDIDADGHHEGDDDYNTLGRRHEDIPAEPADGESEDGTEADMSHLTEANFDSLEDSGETLDTNEADIVDGGEVAADESEDSVEDEEDSVEEEEDSFEEEEDSADGLETAEEEDSIDDPVDGSDEIEEDFAEDSADEGDSFDAATEEDSESLEEEEETDQSEVFADEDGEDSFEDDTFLPVEE